jgi:CBS domain containing-hemolysin-like protein
MNGLFVAAEFALVAIRRTRVEEMVNSGQAGARAIETATTNLDRSIATTQLGITLSSLALGWAGEPALAHLFEPIFTIIPAGWRAVTTHSLAAAVAFLLITFLHVVFGELIPKTMGLQRPDGIARWTAAPLNVFSRLVQPLIRIMTGTGNRILRAIGLQPAGGHEMVHSIEELSLLVEDTEEAGILGEVQADVVQRVFHLSKKRVRDCMIPRDKMAVLERNMPPDKVMEAVRHGAHTRMPVFQGNLENIVGIVNTKDLFFLFSLKGVVILDDALYPPLFVKPDGEVALALEQLRGSRRHMALVRSNEGEILGLITLEDILEEMVGEIEDEHDPLISQTRPTVIRKPESP